MFDVLLMCVFVVHIVVMLDVTANMVCMIVIDVIVVLTLCDDC